MSVVTGANGGELCASALPATAVAASIIVKNLFIGLFPFGGDFRSYNCG
jgi:hypothetical protein